MRLRRATLPEVSDIAPVSILELNSNGSSLRVTARRQPYTPPGEEPWFDCQIVVEAPPLVSGTMSTTFTRADLHDWARSLEGLAHPTSQDGREGARRAVLGGGRGTEVTVEVYEQRGSNEGALAVCIEATTGGDDPYPFVRYLIFDAAPFWTAASQRISKVIDG